MINIPGFEGRYSITSEGDIFSIKKKRYIKAIIGKDGYKKINLYSDDGTMKTLRVSRLVLMSYKPNYTDLPLQVNHIDGNKLNDSLSNLEWVTARENIHHAWKNGLCKPYDRTKPYNRQGIIESNKRRAYCGI